MVKSNNGIILYHCKVKVIHTLTQRRQLIFSNKNANSQHFSTNFQRRNYKWWLRVAMHVIFVLCGQTTATLLGRLYFDRGGQSKWVGALMQLVGFPLLIPCYFFSISPNTDNNINVSRHASPLVLASVYFIFCLLVGGGCYFASMGLSYLPVSTYTLVCTSQFGFTAVFSFLLNSQKFTFLIITSIVLLTFSVLEVIIAQYFVATCGAIVGLFASKEWKDLRREMEEFALGKVSYFLTLLWTVICWEFFAIGYVGLIFEVSSLFSQVISALCLPFVQVLAVIIFHEKMDGLEVVSLLLAIWGFVSYLYQNYLDDYYMSKAETSNANLASPVEEVNE
ncbi:hypothetical protein UlMin_001191 [Ulmus minor]